MPLCLAYAKIFERLLARARDPKWRPEAPIREVKSSPADVSWEMHEGTATGAVADQGSMRLTIPLGQRATITINVTAPSTGTSAALVLQSSKDGRVIEFVDHLHEHFVDPCVIRNAAYMPPTRPGFSIEMKPASIEANTFRP